MFICLLNAPSIATAPPINIKEATIPTKIIGCIIIKNVVNANTAKPIANDFIPSPILSNVRDPLLIGFDNFPNKAIAPPINNILTIKNGIAIIPTRAAKPAKTKPFANDNSEVPIKSKVLAPLFTFFDCLPNSSNVGVSILTAAPNNFIPRNAIGKSKVALTKLTANLPIESAII